MNGRPLTWAVIVDGPSDRALVPVLLWTLRALRPDGLFAEPVVQPRRHEPVAKIVEQVRDRYGPDLILVHRDAEGVGREVRRREIPTDDRVVGVVPVRMTEAWLLFDEVAIRTAAGNPNGTVPVVLPPLVKLERIPDPKRLLHELLVKASELPGRRRQRFDRSEAVQRVARLINDFSPLMGLSAFTVFHAELRGALERI